MFAFVRRHEEWGGDLKAVSDIQEGLKELGRDSFLTYDLADAMRAEEIFFLGTWSDRAAELNLMNLLNRSYGCIAFHADEKKFGPACYGMLQAVARAVEGAISLEELPERIAVYGKEYSHKPFSNRQFLENAKVVIANSPTEKAAIKKDAPKSQAKVVYWTAGRTGEFSDEFLSLAGVKSGQYILQVGRLSMRKNQLGTLLAVKDLDLPLVFVATKGSHPLYERIFLEAAARWRKGPTIVVAQEKIDSQVIQMPGGEILSDRCLLGAIAHAGLYLHPAFSELPGYTYLEAIRFGVPVIASEWTTLNDYFSDTQQVEFVLPYDLKAIRIAVEKMFGRKYSQPAHPIFQRKPIDVARDFIRCL